MLLDFHKFSKGSEATILLQLISLEVCQINLKSQPSSSCNDHIMDLLRQLALSRNRNIKFQGFVYNT